MSFNFMVVLMSIKKKSCVYMSYKKNYVFICHLILNDIYIQIIQDSTQVLRARGG